MKSYIIHGDNSIASRKFLSEIKAHARSENFDVVNLDWSASKKQELLTLARSQNLLSSGVIVIVENFFTNNKKANEILKSLKFDDSISFIFWENRIVTPSNIKGLTKFVVQEFKIPTIIFNFLNSISPKNTKIMLNLLSESLKKDAPEMLMVMIARHVRSLIWVKVESDTYIAPDWMKGRLLAQSSKFKLEELIELHHKLLEIDRDSKTSKLPENVQSSLELLVAQL